MPVVILLLLAAGAILGGVIVVAMGRGGEMARYRAPRPASTDFHNWRDIAGYRPPAALLGYHAGTTEQALLMIARVVAERDAEISWLRSRLAELQPERPSQPWQGGAPQPAAETASREARDAARAVEESELAAVAGDHEEDDDMPASGQAAGATSTSQASHSIQPGDRT